MSIGSTLDPDSRAAPGRIRPPGHDTASLGPGDRSDTGSDSVGDTGLDPAILADDGDASGTGVAGSPLDPGAEGLGADIGFDRVVSAADAGLGGGLDQAEEARYGVTDAAPDPMDEDGAPRDPDDEAVGGGPQQPDDDPDAGDGDPQPPDDDPDAGEGPVGDVERSLGGAGPGDRSDGDAADDPDSVGGPQDDPDAARDDDPPQRGSIERGPR